MKYIYCITLILLSTVGLSSFGQDRYFEKPTPKRGIEQFYKNLGQNLRYPEAAQQESVTGNVYVSFVIKKNGAMAHLRVLKGVRPDLDQEAIRAVKATKAKWKAGIKNGKKVSTFMYIPITFKIDASDLVKDDTVIHVTSLY